MKNSNSIGFDGIKASHLKLSLDVIAPYIVKIVNQSFRQSKFPDSMKTAKIVPIFKSGSPTDKNNYRPIAILPVLSKILEKVVHKRLLNFLESNSSLYVKQYGFIKNSNTNCALFDIITKIQESIDSGCKTSGLFLDLAKAFDVVNHRFLLEKLRILGIRFGSARWFSSYLFNRKQYVDCNGISSNFMTNSSGVPQGSILGPLLFLIFIDDIKNLNLFGNLQLFADDTAILYSEMNWDILEVNMNKDLETIKIWMSRNKLLVNAKKSCFITFGNSAKPDLNIKIGIDFIEHVDKVKYLGILIDEKINFEEHINFVKNKISSIIGLLFKLRRILPLNAKKMIYFSLIHSNMAYACEVWGHCANTRIERVFVLQKKAVKAMCGLSYRSHSHPIFCEHSILPLRSLINFKACLHLHGSLNHYIRTNQSFLHNHDIHHHNTRNRNHLHFFRNLTVRNGVRSILFKSKVLYNNPNIVPENIKHLDKFKFKKNLRKCFEISLLNPPNN
jgi:hypothetical protein